MSDNSFDGLASTAGTVSFVARDTVQIRLELGEVIDAAATGDLPEGVTAAQAGEWIVRDGAILGRVSGDGTTFQAVDVLAPSPLSDDLGRAGDAARWTATVNGGAAEVVGVSRKSNILDSARTGEFVTNYDFATLQNVFVRLAAPLEEGDAVVLTLDAPGWPEIRATADFGGTVSEAIHVGLAGFEPGTTSKTAYLSSWNGVDAAGNRIAQDYGPDTSWAVIDEATGAAVLTGTVTLDKPAGETDRGRNFAQADVWEIDFSELTEAGTYHLRVDGVGISQSFEVGAEVYDAAHATALRGLYHQRSGIALEAPFTEWDRPASFPEGTEVIRTDIKISETNEGYDGRLPNPKPLFEGRTTGEVETDVFGGWHDAGDWDRRTQHLEASRKLMEMVELSPGFSKGLDANIPESGNALPDALDEALWGMEIFRQLQDEDGGVSGGVQSAGDPLYGEGSWSESQGVYAYAPDTWTSWEYAATAAKAAFLLGSADPARAAEYEASAVAAWTWAEARLDEADLDARPEIDARNVAAAELYRLTGEEAYHDVFVATTSYTKPVEQITFREHQWEAATTYARTDRPLVDAQIAATGIADMADEAFDLTERYDGAAFGQTYNPFAPYGYGKSFSQPSDAANLFVRLHALTGEAEYLALSEEAVQFGLGANPMNMSFMTGLEGPKGAVRDPEELLVVDADTLGKGPPPGIVAYGTYDPRTYPGFYEGVMNGDLAPNLRDAPILETFNAYFYNIPGTEFTVQQGMTEMTYVLGYLAAQDDASGARATRTVDLANGVARNVIDLGVEDLTLLGFDVDGGGETTFDTLRIDGTSYATAAEFAALAAGLNAGAQTGAAVDGADLRLDLGTASVVLRGVIGNGLDAGAFAAQAPDERPSRTVDLKNGTARNVVEVGAEDLVLVNFDVDGGGEATFDTFVLDGRRHSTDADLLALAEALEADPAGDAALEGDDLVLDTGTASVRLADVMGTVAEAEAEALNLLLA